MAEKEERKEDENTNDEELEEKQSSQDESRRDWLQKYFARAFGISNEPKPECLLEEVTFEGIAKYIASEKCQKIVTMAGAGISTSAGIPDYRTPGTGLYANLEKYNLPSPQTVFSIDFFKENPKAFFSLAKEREVLWSNAYKNIDTLERVAGLNGDKIIEAHGSVRSSSCLECQRKYSQEWMKKKVFADELPQCETKDCKGIVKPDVVFFGESLPDTFSENIGLVDDCDLLIILGTSLVVQPFASLTNRVKPNTPRLYINLEKSGNENSHPMMILLFGGGFDFDGENNIRDVFWQGTCDDGCFALADLIGWGDELRKLIKDEHARLAQDATATEISKPSATTKVTPAKTAYTSPTKSSKPSTQKSSSKTENTAKISPKHETKK